MKFFTKVGANKNFIIEKVLKQTEVVHDIKSQ